MTSSFQSISGQSLGSVDALNSLKAQATRDPKASIRETARQFESLFMQEVMKSMRASTLSSGMLDNNATQLGTEMLDTQFAGKMSGLPGGLSEAIQRQLQRRLVHSINETLEQKEGFGGGSNVYFTNFVVQ